MRLNQAAGIIFMIIVHYILLSAHILKRKVQTITCFLLTIRESSPFYFQKAKYKSIVEMWKMVTKCIKRKKNTNSKLKQIIFSLLRENERIKISNNHFRTDVNTGINILLHVLLPQISTQSFRIYPRSFIVQKGLKLWFVQWTCRGRYSPSNWQKKIVRLWSSLCAEPTTH